MFRRQNRRPRCLAETADGGKCQNYKATCPYKSHQRATSRAFEVKPSAPLRLSSASLETAKSLADDPSQLQRLCNETAQHYNLEPAVIEQDYWLLRSLYAWIEAAGGSDLPRPYLPPSQSASAGRVLFAGGTSLTAAWNIAPRWSEDVDLVVVPTLGLGKKKIRAACKYNARKASNSIGAKFHGLEEGPQHIFFEIRRSDPVSGTRMDISFRTVPSMLVANRSVSSLIGRIVEQDVRDHFPELGGFTVPAVSPGLIMTDKLLAQTQVAESRVWGTSGVGLVISMTWPASLWRGHASERTSDATRLDCCMSPNRIDHPTTHHAPQTGAHPCGRSIPPHPNMRPWRKATNQCSTVWSGERRYRWTKLSVWLSRLMKARLNRLQALRVSGWSESVEEGPVELLCQPEGRISCLRSSWRHFQTRSEMRRLRDRMASRLALRVNDASMFVKC